VGIASAGEELMLSFQFSDLLLTVAGNKEARLFVSVVIRLSDVVTSFLEEANSNFERPQHFNIQNSVISSVRNVTNDVDIWSLYDSAKAYMASLKEPKLPPETTKLLSSQVALTQKFLEHYKRYMLVRDYATSFDLMLLAHQIRPGLVGLSAAAVMAAENLEASSREDESELEVLSSSLIRGLEDYIKVFSALLLMYCETCKLVGVDPHLEPLIVEKLETGSLYLKLKGAIKAIKVMTQVLKSAIRYGAMHHSLAGRIDQLPKAADAVDKVIGLRESLAKNGVDVSKIDSEIESATLKIAKQANLIISRMNEIGLNGEILTSKEQLLIALEESTPKLLGFDDDQEGSSQK